MNMTQLCPDALYDSGCPGYATAYFNQQCDIMHYMIQLVRYGLSYFRL